jgi:hypothetical protein
MTRRLAAISVAVLVILAATAGSVLAQPANDNSLMPTVIDSVPFADTLDTTTATSDPADPSDFCGPFTNTVWYKLESGPAGISHLILRTLASDYTAVMHVAAGSPGGTFAACGSGEIAFDAAPSTTYYIMIGDCCGTGGTLQFSATQGLAFGGTVNHTGSFDAKSGTATISGTYTCTRRAVIDAVEVSLAQPIGRFIVSGGGETFPGAVCEPGTSFSWTLQVHSSNGKFAGGKATARLAVFGHDDAESWISNLGTFATTLKK